MIGLEMLCAVVRRGMRNVALPGVAPVSVSLVIEYPQSTVRHEIVPERADPCAVCGGYVPEGAQVCARCERGT